MRARTSTGRYDVAQLRKRVGMVFQKPNPFPMTIYDNIAYGPRTHGIETSARSWMKSWRGACAGRGPVGRGTTTG